MPITIKPYSEEMVPAVRAFNRILDEGDVAPEFRFPESSVPSWLPRLPNRAIYQQYYLAVDGEAVRGGFILKYQDFSFLGESRPIAYYHLPLSQGIVSKPYAGVGVLMLHAALKMEPALFALGMGGFDRPLPRMLTALGWKMSAVPFFFRVVNTGAFLREFPMLNRSTAIRIGSAAARRTGIGWLAIHAAQRVRVRRAEENIRLESITDFGGWADDLWRKCDARYTFIGNRDRNTLNILYPPGKNFHCIRMLRDSEVVGWAVVLNTQMRDNKYFGNLRVGSIVDCLAAPENANVVIHSAAQFLDEMGSDLIVANHSHNLWGQAFYRAGFLSGPSNFIFAPSPGLAQLMGPSHMGPSNKDQPGVFLMRGDGDGPVNL